MTTANDVRAARCSIYTRKVARVQTFANRDAFNKRVVEDLAAEPEYQWVSHDHWAEGQDPQPGDTWNGARVEGQRVAEFAPAAADAEPASQSEALDVAAKALTAAISTAQAALEAIGTAKAMG